ncbi:MAG TPA: alpha/beta hydrolase [Sphingomicrobium sp.]|nr:alpha/beta hydrolase [Sphingomicrobium sp.]
MKRLYQCLCGAAAAFGCLLLTGAGPPGPSPAFSWNDYARPHRLVDVGGGRRLNLFCLGSGSPTVILDGGLGDDITSWRKVHSELARTTKVCAYDRAGNGFSDPGPLPRSAAALSDDLERLIRAARLRPPYVIVGASIAGLHVRLFVDRHLPDVAGVVLVDPSFEHQVARYEEVTPASRASAEQQIATFRSCIGRLRGGVPAAGSQTWKDCIVDPDPDLPPGVVQALVERETSDFYRMALSELLEFEGRSAEQIDASRRSWGDLPLIILTASGTSPPDADQAIRNRVWMEAHDRMAKLSSRGANRVVANATHHIQLSQPDAVIAAVNEVVASARSHPAR